MSFSDENEDEAFIRAWEKREEREQARDLGRVFRAHGAGTVPPHPAAVAEQRRVSQLLSSDRAYRATEAMRTQALGQMENGEYANIRDSVSTPTPEQMRQGERAGGRFRPFTPRSPDRTVHTVTAYRRQDLPQIARLVLSGAIGPEAMMVCRWYRNLWETAGLAGTMRSTDFTKEVFSAPNARDAFTDRQLEQQDTLRAVRAMMSDPARLTLLDKVVLEDMPFSRAFRLSGFRTRQMRMSEAQRAKRLFADIVDDLAAARKAIEDPR